MAFLENMAGIGDGTGLYKQLRPTQITKSEEKVAKVMTVLVRECIKSVLSSINYSI